MHVTLSTQTLLYIFDLTGHVCEVSMATEAVEIAMRLPRRKRKPPLLLHPTPCLLPPCCLCRPLRTWAMRKEGRRRFGCLCSDTWTEPSCWPAWPSVRPGTSGTSHTLIVQTKRHAHLRPNQFLVPKWNSENEKHFFFINAFVENVFSSTSLFFLDLKKSLLSILTQSLQHYQQLWHYSSVIRRPCSAAK